MKKTNIHKDRFHGEWNYTIKPKNKSFGRKVSYFCTAPKDRKTIITHGLDGTERS